MSFFRKNPVFTASLSLCALVVVGECALIYERYAASQAAAKRFEQRKVELQAMAELAPPPKRDVAAAIEADLAKAQGALASMQNELKGRGPAAERIRTAKVPTARTDAYFDLATFVEKTREAAVAADVEIRTEAARFGFSAYANEGPMQDHIEPVFRQRLIAQYLLDSLIEAKPRSIFSVKRERTVTKAEREARAAAAANGEAPPPDASADSGEDSPDYFAIDPRVTARVPGFVDTTPFRFVFTGQTSALRTFLNRLAAFDLPVLVREVEVEAATPEEAAAQAAKEGEGDAAPAPASVALPTTPVAKAAAAKSAANAARVSAAVPIVAKPLSKFTVTVEFVELVTPPPPPADAPAATPST